MPEQQPYHKSKPQVNCNLRPEMLSESEYADLAVIAILWRSSHAPVARRKPTAPTAPWPERRRAGLQLFHSYAFGQVAWFVHVAAELDCQMISKKLQRNDG
jgi:hypothetical protein